MSNLSNNGFCKYGRVGGNERAPALSSSISDVILVPLGGDVGEMWRIN